MKTILKNCEYKYIKFWQVQPILQFWAIIIIRKKMVLYQTRINYESLEWKNKIFYQKTYSKAEKRKKIFI